MGYKVDCDIDNRFVYTRVFGEVNSSNLMEHVIALNKSTEKVTGVREFGDCSRITDMSGLTAPGAAAAADYEANRPNSKLAIYVTKDPLIFGMARAFQTFSMDHRKEVRIFHNCEEALGWLADDALDLKRMLDFVASHPDD